MTAGDSAGGESGIEALISRPIRVYLQRAPGLLYFSPPETESVWGEEVSLPMYPETANGDVRYVGGVGDASGGK